MCIYEYQNGPSVYRPTLLERASYTMSGLRPRLSVVTPLAFGGALMSAAMATALSPVSAQAAPLLAGIGTCPWPKIEEVNGIQKTSVEHVPVGEAPKGHLQPVCKSPLFNGKGGMFSEGFSSLNISFENGTTVVTEKLPAEPIVKTTIDGQPRSFGPHCDMAPGEPTDIFNSLCKEIGATAAQSTTSSAVPTLSLSVSPQLPESDSIPMGESATTDSSPPTLSYLSGALAAAGALFLAKNFIGAVTGGVGGSMHREGRDDHGASLESNESLGRGVTGYIDALVARETPTIGNSEGKPKSVSSAVKSHKKTLEVGCLFYAVGGLSAIAFLTYILSLR